MTTTEHDNTTGTDPATNIVLLLHELTANIRGLNEWLRQQFDTERHETSPLTNLLGQHVNDVLWVGGIQLDSAGFKRVPVKAPFASVTIADPLGSGPFVLSNGALSSSDVTTDNLLGPGFWQVPAGAHETIPITGRELTIGGPAGAKLYVALFVSPRPYSFGPATGSSGAAISSTGPTSVTASTTSEVLSAAATNRQGLFVVNADPASNLYLTYGATSSATLYTVKLVPGAYWEMPAPFYPGVVSGIWDGTPTGHAMVTEVL
jgi:hypothetical protein